MNFDETQQKMILREMEKDLLAIVAVDIETSALFVVGLNRSCIFEEEPQSTQNRMKQIIL